MNNIPSWILKKYKLQSLEEYKTAYSEKHTGVTDMEMELDYCKLFLHKTDHIPNKIIEAQMLGKEIDDYTEILEYRQVARDEINRLEAEQEVNNEFE